MSEKNRRAIKRHRAFVHDLATALRRELDVGNPPNLIATTPEMAVALYRRANPLSSLSDQEVWGELAASPNVTVDEDGVVWIAAHAHPIVAHSDIVDAACRFRPDKW